MASMDDESVKDLASKVAVEMNHRKLVPEDLHFEQHTWLKEFMEEQKAKREAAENRAQFWRQVHKKTFWPAVATVAALAITTAWHFFERQIGLK